MRSAGSHKTTCGNSVQTSITATLAARNGAAPRKIEPIPSLEIAAQTFRQLPTGGVQAPTAKPETRITPN